MKSLILLADGFEDIQLFHPWYRLREEGVEVRLATPGGRPVTGKHGYRVKADSPIDEVNPGEYDLLLLPGGDAPARLRLQETPVAITRMFAEDGRPVAAVCHGPQLLISAGCLDGRIVTCAPTIRDDVRAAGATYRDEAVVTDGNLITARGSDDLPEFGKALVATLGVRA